MDSKALEELELAAVMAEQEERYEEAYSLFHQLAKMGNAYAMSALARLYEDGRGVKPDFNKALWWAEQAIAGGNVTAIYNLAVTYRRIGNLRQAKGLFERVLALGELSAALDLAKMFMISDKETETVRKYLNMVLLGTPQIDVSEDNFEEAEKLLAELDGWGLDDMEALDEHHRSDA